jgi:hypothetical protein
MSEEALKGFQEPESGATDYNAQMFLIRQLLAQMNTATLVQIKAVNTSAQTVDAMPLVNQLDGFGNGIQHVTVYGLPYMRIQAGTNAIVIDPAVGDIGVAVFANRDISTVIATKKVNNPGSRRMFSMSDGVYLGGVLGAAPVNFVKITGNDINITATGNVNVQAPAINLGNGGTLRKLVNELFETIYNAHTHNDPQGGVSSPPNTLMDNTMLTSVIKAE